MNLQVKNVPPELHERLRRHARSTGRTIDDVVLTALERELARQDWNEQLARRPATELDTAAALLLERERRGRDDQLGYRTRRS